MTTWHKGPPPLRMVACVANRVNHFVPRWWDGQRWSWGAHCLTTRSPPYGWRHARFDAG